MKKVCVCVKVGLCNWCMNTHVRNVTYMCASVTAHNAHDSVSAHRFIM